MTIMQTRLVDDTLLLKSFACLVSCACVSQTSGVGKAIGYIATLSTSIGACLYPLYQRYLRCQENQKVQSRIAEFYVQNSLVACGPKDLKVAEWAASYQKTPDTPTSFTCPITGKIMKQPVFYQGLFYEKTALKKDLPIDDRMRQHITDYVQTRRENLKSVPEIPALIYRLFLIMVTHATLFPQSPRLTTACSGYGLYHFVIRPWWKLTSLTPEEKKIKAYAEHLSKQLEVFAIQRRLAFLSEAEKKSLKGKEASVLAFFEGTVTDKALACPLTRGWMFDPVQNPENQAEIYERLSIRRAFLMNPKSPLTRLPMTDPATWQTHLPSQCATVDYFLEELE